MLANQTITAVIAAATAEAIAPAISVTSNATVTAVISSAAADALVPSASVGSNITVVAVLAETTADALAPAIATTSNVTITSVAATTTADALAPTVSVGTSITVNAVSAAATSDALAPAISVTSNATVIALISSAAADVLAPAVTSATQDHQIDIGYGYMDFTARQVVRTSGNVLYVSSWKFDTYPHGGIGGGEYNSQTLRMYKAGQTGLPTSFTRLDSAHEPAGVVSWAMAIDRDDVIHVVWTTRDNWDGGVSYGWDGTDNYLKYCQFNPATDTWGTVEDIETTMATIERGQSDELVSISIDSAGVPHIVYLKHDGTRRRVTYRNKSTGSWSSAVTVDDQSFGTNERCWHPGIVFDNAGRIVVTWMRGTHESQTDGRYFIRVYDGSWGTTHDLTGANIWCGIDTGTPLYIDANNRYHAAFISTSQYVRYYYTDDQGATWTANNPGSGTYATHNPSPGPGPNGTVRIYSHGAPAVEFNIVYFQGAGGAGAWGSLAEYQDGNIYDCSVNVRWSQYWWWYPNTRDVVYWESAYPTNELYAGVEIDGTDAIVKSVAASAAAAAPAPAVSTTSNVTVTAVSATAAADALAPSVSTGNSTTISSMVANAAAEAIAPAVSVTANVTMVATIATATAAANAPTIGIGVDVTAAIAECSAAAGEPVISAGSAVLIAGVLASATALALEPVITATAYVTVNGVAATAIAVMLAPMLGTGRGYVTLSETYAASVTISEAIATVVAGDSL